jgi:hypothetical protein
MDGVAVEGVAVDGQRRSRWRINCRRRNYVRRQCQHGQGTRHGQQGALQASHDPIDCYNQRGGKEFVYGLAKEPRLDQDSRGGGKHVGEPEDKVTLEVVLKPLQVVSFPPEVECRRFAKVKFAFSNGMLEPLRLPRPRYSSIHIVPLEGDVAVDPRVPFNPRFELLDRHVHANKRLSDAVESATRGQQWPL